MQGQGCCVLIKLSKSTYIYRNSAFLRKISKKFHLEDFVNLYSYSKKVSTIIVHTTIVSTIIVHMINTISFTNTSPMDLLPNEQNFDLDMQI